MTKQDEPLFCTDFTILSADRRHYTSLNIQPKEMDVDTNGDAEYINSLSVYVRSPPDWLYESGVFSGVFTTVNGRHGDMIVTEMYMDSNTVELTLQDKDKYYDKVSIA